MFSDVTEVNIWNLTALYQPE